jgi:hypothetical protein
LLFDLKDRVCVFFRYVGSFSPDYAIGYKKGEVFILTAMRTSNPKEKLLASKPGATRKCEFS